MQIKPIRTKASYAAVLKEIATLMDSQAGMRRGKRLNALCRLVQAYERKHFPMELPPESSRRSVRSRSETARLTISRANVRRLHAAHAEIEGEIAKRRRRV